jgi:2-oxoglutarate ferredoxin oxidoreductase subunit gamma
VGVDGRVEVRLAGSGGQGIGLAGLILAEAAILSGRNAAQSQAYGPESRGGASRSDVVIADGEIGFPKATRPDVLVALTREACERYRGEVRPGGLLLADRRAADAASGPLEVRVLPLEDAARRVGDPVAANMVALGALAVLTGLVAPAALERAVVARVGPRHRDLDLRALAAGAALAREAGAGPAEGGR